MGKPAKLHEVQQLAGRVAALSWFIAGLGEKALPFCALIKKSDFFWVDRRSRSSILAAEKSALHTTSVGRTKREGTTTTIHRRYTPGGEHGASGWTKWRGEGARSPVIAVRC
jgi:hypothetical protein